MTRLKKNVELLGILKNIIENNPDLRFGQILFNYGFVLPDHYEKKKGWMMKDPFHEEPSTTLERVNQCLKDYGQGQS